MTDPFEGTVYRYIATADDAVQLARYYGVVDGLEYRPDIAVEYIDRALEALQSARARLIGGAS